MRSEYREVRRPLKKTLNLIITRSRPTSGTSEYRIYSVKTYVAPQVPKLLFAPEPHDLVGESIFRSFSVSCAIRLPDFTHFLCYEIEVKYCKLFEIAYEIIEKWWHLWFLTSGILRPWALIPFQTDSPELCCPV
jgi:hypothetical protein